MHYFHLFLSCQLLPHVHRRTHWLALAGVAAWFYFAFIQMGFWTRFFQAELVMIDLLIGLPLVIALGPVIYGILYWAVKWWIIFLKPDLLACPEDDREDEEHPYQKR